VDVDGTLIKGNSAEKLFFWFLFRKGYMRRGNFVRFVLRMVWYTLTVGLDQAKGRNKSYLKGESEDKIREWIREYSREVLPGLISPVLRSRIAALREQGYEIILLSGSLQMLVEEIVRAVGAQKGIGVRLEKKAGGMTGRISGIYPFSESKLKALREHCDFSRIDWKHSWAFADRVADLPVLESVGNPVVVNPEKRLENIAKKRGWEILKW